MVNSILLLWALVGLIGGVHGKCSLAPIADNDRSIAYACIHGDLNDLDELSSETEWIEFSVSRFQTIPDDAFHRFPNLRRLSFYNCHVNLIEPAAFRGLNRLDWLIFHGTRIHAVRSAWFRHLPNLRRLILDSIAVFIKFEGIDRPRPCAVAYVKRPAAYTFGNVDDPVIHYNRDVIRNPNIR